MSVRIQLRRDTAANWASANPTLTQGEPGYETDTGKIKYGDGSTAWNSLGYAPAAAVVDGIIVDADINASAAISGSKIQAATTTNAGAVQLTDSTSSTSTTTAATPNSVKSAYDLAAAALPKAGGTMTGDVVFSGTQTFPGTVTSVDVTGGTGLTSSGGPITSSGAITVDLDNTAVTPGSYNYASITVDQQGRLTAASNGTAPLTSGDIGVTVQGYDADTAKLDATQTFTAAQTFSAGANDAAGGFRIIPQNSKTSSYTLIASDTGKHISITTGGVTVPASVFSAGDVVSIYNNSGSNQTITQGSSATLRQAGTSNTGNRTLAQYGLATVMCVASNTFVISGAGLS